MDTDVHQVPGTERIVRTSKRAETTTPRALRRFLCLDDFQPVARQILPRQIYGYYAGAAERGAALEGNADSFKRVSLVPRVLVDVSRRSTRTTLFGHTHAMPVGIAPMGLSGLSTFEGDLVLARAARASGTLMVTSATSIVPLERIAGEGGSQWFQCYLPGEQDRIEAMLSRVAQAGFETIVVTVDVPVLGNRENNVRNGFSIPLQPSPRLLWDGLTHASWSARTFLKTLSRGMPHFENMDAGRGPALLSSSVVREIGKRDQLSWRHLALMRRCWPGKLVVKGILSPHDVDLAGEAGADGVWVSNHGGRQLDATVAPLDVLPAIAARAGTMTVMIDGGVRRGTDVLKALALGADFVFIGRPFLFAAAARGEAGVRHALNLIQEEIDRDMALLGIASISEITMEFIHRTTADANRWARRHEG